MEKGKDPDPQDAPRYRDLKELVDKNMIYYVSAEEETKMLLLLKGCVVEGEALNKKETQKKEEDSKPAATEPSATITSTNDV